MDIAIKTNAKYWAKASLLMTGCLKKPMNAYRIKKKKMNCVKSLIKILVTFV